MELLSSDKPEDIIKDGRLILRADKEDWPIPEEVKSDVVKRLHGIVNKTQVAVVDGEGGVNYDEDRADKNSNNASKILAMLVEQNRKRQQSKNPRPINQPTVNVGVQVNGNPQSGRMLASTILERIRIEGVSGVIPATHSASDCGGD